MRVRSKNLLIGALSRRTGVTVETIRYYERIGLLAPPPRSAGGHRLYDGTDRQRLEFIKRCRELGFRLDDVRALLDLLDAGYTCGTVREAASKRLSDLRHSIAVLQRAERTLTETIAQCDGADARDCAIIDSLLAEGIATGR